jgi:hypothetical protein
MNQWNSHEDEYYPDEAEITRQHKTDQVSAALTTSLFSFVLKILFFFVLFCPAILCAYLILNRFKSYTENLTRLHYFFVMTALVYGIECLVFFVKGWLLVLKKNGNGLWVLLWTICMLYCFVLPVLLVHTAIFEMFRPAPGHPTSTLNIISWISAVLISYYIYARYRLQSNTAPSIVAWAYQIGRKMGGR